MTGKSGKCPAKKRFVHRYVFQPDGPHARFHFQNPVNQQKRRAMRYDRLNLSDIHHDIIILPQDRLHKISRNHQE